MIVNNSFLDNLTDKAKENPKLRCNLDMRNSAEDNSQRMLNALEPGTIMPIHRRDASLCLSYVGRNGSTRRYSGRTKGYKEWL